MDRRCEMQRATVLAVEPRCQLGCCTPMLVRAQLGKNTKWRAHTTGLAGCVSQSSQIESFVGGCEATFVSQLVLRRYREQRDTAACRESSDFSFVRRSLDLHSRLHSKAGHGRGEITRRAEAAIEGEEERAAGLAFKPAQSEQPAQRKTEPWKYAQRPETRR